MAEIHLALVAHDAKKDAMVEWARPRLAQLQQCTLYGTGTTGGRLQDELGLSVTRMKSGPLGGDAQLGAMIAEGRLNALIFFTDPLSALPHDVDVKSLLRLGVYYDTPLAMSPSTATMVLDGLVR
ncbi:methylglyoxal synthase [Actibacterium mucosum KCTC 23349]|uniref:Methylglyoxal synthase n=1 Tax=Actibacterium mucosum KCTC 23349 TaxID=1454373 RepID=A0A037ZH48_9RHOB|nr:methylglyoxal synthase [Actibacterium mucosum]KAJ55443.1 methylglyoxal synthase [Actibacterium mucosum KCTC 23349]